MRDTCVRAISISASFRSSGGSAIDLSSMISTAVPPRPNTTTGPKVGSSASPAMSSRALGRRTIGCTVTPATRAPGFSRSARAEDVGRRLAHRLLAREVELDAADIGFVDDVRREDLHRDGAALGEDRARRRCGLPAVSARVTGATGMS